MWLLILHVDCMLQLDINVANHMISEICAHAQLFDLSKVGQLLVNFLIEFIEMILRCLIVTSIRERGGPRLSKICRRGLVHVSKKHSLREKGLIVLPGTTVSMSASANFEVERTVHPVLLSAVNTGQTI
eukprot:CAMPEP_0113677766 /NCGR_PEP_ID=MMETSP0038_2-20120614/9487_1 /TAXON_ID=2898 /ORGANISM="Cryptomonas paramecium" /LENGTH=128 /DNA_ID=CAMNT_0000595155 /DNA_START=370 /DNA_END=753 /DNA_ORIENTATION=+ /assembly_acc=CAM_ASM_000170